MDCNIRDDKSYYKIYLKDSSLNFSYLKYSVLSS